VTAVPVTWTSLVKATASGSSVIKSGGCNGCADSGALSVQEIPSGDGYLEFTTADARRLRFVGLGARNTGTTGGEIKYALRLARGVAEVREGGSYRAEARFASGDALRIAVSGGVVQYSKNGQVFYTSQVAPTYPLVADTALYDAKADVSQAVIASSSADAGAPAPTPTPSPGSGGLVSWGGLINATLSGSLLYKSSGCDGCADAGAVAAQQVASGGYVEFTVDEVSRLRYLGLGAPGGNPTTVTMPWSLRVANGYAEVRESGAYRSDTPVAAGDVLRISVSGSSVTYSKNGGVFYSSATPASSTLAVYARLNSINATIASATVGGQ
jgi:hypothetical protein